MLFVTLQSSISETSWWQMFFMNHFFRRHSSNDLETFFIEFTFTPADYLHFWFTYFTEFHKNGNISVNMLTYISTNSNNMYNFHLIHLFIHNNCNEVGSRWPWRRRFPRGRAGQGTVVYLCRTSEPSAESAARCCLLSTAESDHHVTLCETPSSAHKHAINQSIDQPRTELDNNPDKANPSPAFGIYRWRELASAPRYKTCLM